MEENVKTQVEQAPAAKKSKSKFRLVAFLTILGIICAIAGYKVYVQNVETESEKSAYNVLEGNENLADYEDYLNRFPEGEHAIEVRDRYEALQKMYADWRSIVLNGKQRDFETFKKNYPESMLYHQCDLKIDSLDWLDAQAEGTAAAVREYLDKHPTGQYASEADIMQGKIADSMAGPEELMLISNTINGFYTAFGHNDAEGVFSFITPTMTQFLSKTQATKADVADLIDRTYNEHIQSCRFVVNDDFIIKKNTDSEGNMTYHVEFSVDQHISRDNEGKTFGSYTAVASLTPQFKISALTMKEVSRR